MKTMCTLSKNHRGMHFPLKRLYWVSWWFSGQRIRLPKQGHGFDPGSRSPHMPWQLSLYQITLSLHAPTRFGAEERLLGRQTLEPQLEKACAGQDLHSQTYNAHIRKTTQKRKDDTLHEVLCQTPQSRVPQNYSRI